jgi:methyl-accepting chemotaxis protein
MDQFTQKNAAMVEEATAVTHRLADSARNLAGLVSQFRMAGTATSAARSSAAPSYSAPAPAYRPAGRPAAAAAAETRPVASPARKMVGNLAKAFGGGNTAAAASQDNWEEF